MSIAFLISALLLGLASSLHCVGMCGPLVMSVPVQHLPENKKISGVLIYQTGRIAIYAVLGIVAGLIGWRMYAAGLQQIFSITVGVLLLLMLTGSLLQKKLHVNNWLSKKLSELMFWAIHRKSSTGMLLMGAANALLPCGMVYIAVTGAMASGTVGASAVFMIFFGLGTLPSLLALAIWGVRLNWQTRQYMQKMVPYVVAITAILLIVRGLNLNIPYISPSFTERSIDTVSCH